MPGNEQYTSDTEQSLAEQIQEKLVIEEPDAESLLNAVEGGIEIIDGRYSVILKDEIHDRDPSHRVMTYLLGRYCAARLSDGEVSAATDRADLIDRFGRNVVADAINHGWIEHWDSRVRLNPRSYDAAAKELAARYGQRTVNPATEQ